MATEQALNIPYKFVSGVDPDLLSLDIYHFSNSTTNKPIVVYIHGGGWAVGDKANIGDKGTLFLNNNYIFVSINYRLSPASAPVDITTWNASRIKHATHIQDCADALKWIYDNIEDYGGNNENIVIIGHSAGAHLAALLATNQTYLSGTGFPISSIKGVVANDTEGYDILDQILNPTGGGEAGSVTPQVLYQNAFGIYPDVAVTGTPSPVTIDFPNTSTAQLSYATASPQNNVSASTLPILVISRGASDRRTKQSSFYNALVAVGIAASKIIIYPDSTSYTHSEINQSIGSAQDPPAGKVLPAGVSNVTTEILNWVVGITSIYPLSSASIKLKADVQQGWHSAIVEMFDLDLSPITGDVADVFYFSNQLKPDDTKIQWKGNTYEPLPIIATGYEKSTSGQIEQPSLTVANVLGTFSELIKDYEDMVGAKVTRRRTLGKYLDGEAGADPLQEFPIDIYYIERKSQENALTITWELASILDLEGLKLPRRIITQNLCLWRYRSSECGYTGAPLLTDRDALLSTGGLSGAATTLINTFAVKERRYAELEITKQNRNKAFEYRNQACEFFTLFGITFDPSSGTYVEGNRAFRNGIPIALTGFVRAGRQRSIVNGRRRYELEDWEESTSACATSTTAYDTAQAALVAAQAAYDVALGNYNAAFAALPEDDPIWQLDICGKRTSSCKLRFPRQALPFGGFPGASLQK
jgi:lambda family phage minor tail protein L